MSDKNIFGLHSSFYYVGLQHLCANMYQYIKAGLDRNEFVCLFTNYDLYNSIKQTMRINAIDILCIQSVSKLLNIYKSLGAKGMKDELLKYEYKIINKGYSGVRFIIDAKHVITSTSKEDFLKVDSDITEVISKTKSSVMCIYDFEDYINDKKTIDNEIINESYRTHPFRLYNNKLVDSKKLLKI